MMKNLFNISVTKESDYAMKLMSSYGYLMTLPDESDVSRKADYGQKKFKYKQHEFLIPF